MNDNKSNNIHYMAAFSATLTALTVYSSALFGKKIFESEQTPIPAKEMDNPQELEGKLVKASTQLAKLLALFEPTEVEPCPHLEAEPKAPPEKGIVSFSVMLDFIRSFEKTLQETPHPRVLEAQHAHLLQQLAEARDKLSLADSYVPH